MASWDVRLINGNYLVENNAPVIYLYGKTREGKTIAIRYEGFKPYFFVCGDVQKIKSELEKDARVTNVEEDELVVDGSNEECARITVKIPRDVPGYREKFRSLGYKVFASDIVFVYRFIYSMNLSSCVKVIGEELPADGKTTADIFVKAKKFEECDVFNPQFKILSFDIENSVKDAHLFVIGCIIKDGEELRKETILGDEKKMIEDFVELIKREDPDVVTGYNIDNYDIPILLNRADEHGIRALNIGRDLSEIRSRNERFWICHGRMVADAWWNAKLEVRPKQETLDHVAKLLLGEGKGDIDPTRMDEEWASNRQKVIDYCLKDAELALRILEKIGSLQKAMDLAAVSKLPVDDVLNGRTSTLIDSILIRKADENKIAVPQTHHKRRGADEVKRIEGGYVHSIQPGLYNWVCVLDFKAMYPSIIISNNICFTTLSAQGEIESPVKGVRFMSKNQKTGLLPGILESLMKDRDEIKKKMARAKTDEKKKYYDGLQFAVKTLMNAFYGVFASSFYRFTNPKIGASITAFARDNIKSIIDVLKNENIVVIYGDTDSVFFQSPQQNLEQALEFGQKIAERFSKDGITIELRNVLESFFSHGRKKRYVGKVVWPEEDMLVRGYEIRRTDAFDFQSESLSQVFEKVLGGDSEGAVKLARHLVTDTLEGKAPLDKLVISRTCKDFGSYKNPDVMTNVQAAKKLMKLGYEFVPGMKVSWIVVNGTRSPQEVEPYISGRSFERKPDYKYYANRLAVTLSYVTDVFNWDEKSLVAGTQQVTLFREDFKSERKDKEKKKKVKKTKKPLSLEDFM